MQLLGFFVFVLRRQRHRLFTLGILRHNSEGKVRTCVYNQVGGRWARLKVSDWENSIFFSRSKWSRGMSYSVYLCECVWVHACAGVLTHVGTYGTQGWPWASSSVILHCIFGLSVNLEFRFTRTGLSESPWDLLASASPSGLGFEAHPSTLAFMWLLGVWTQGRMPAQQAYYHHTISTTLEHILFKADKGSRRCLHGSELWWALVNL